MSELWTECPNLGQTNLYNTLYISAGSIYSFSIFIRGEIKFSRKSCFFQFYRLIRENIQDLTYTLYICRIYIQLFKFSTGLIYTLLRGPHQLQCVLRGQHYRPNIRCYSVQGYIKFPIPPPWEDWNFSKSVWEEYQVWKRESNIKGWGRI